MKNWINWPNIIRAVALAILSIVFIADFVMGVLARAIPNEAYLGLIAVVLGVDIKMLRDAFMRILGGGKGGKDA